MSHSKHWTTFACRIQIWSPWRFWTTVGEGCRPPP